MIAMTEECPIFENEEWIVTESGLEHKKTGYFIARDSLASRRADGLWAWPLHMAEKRWCAALPFTEAFSCAVSAYSYETGADLARTFTMAHREIASWPGRDEVHTQLAPMPFSALQRDGTAPISARAVSAEYSGHSSVFHRSGVHRTIPDRKIKSPSLDSKRPRLSNLSMLKMAGLHWRAPRRFRKTGTKLVRLFQAAWSLR